MSEVTEFMVWRSALADTPPRVAAALSTLPTPLPSSVTYFLVDTVRSEAAALARLEALLARDPGPLPEAADPPAGWQADPAAAWAALRERILALLDRVGEESLLASARLPSGKPLSPYSLAGELANHDVLMLAQLRRA